MRDKMERKNIAAWKKIWMVLIFAVMLSAAAAPACTINASAASISKKSVRLVKGRTTKLKISGTAKKVRWRTTNKAVVSVSSTGKVTARKKGIATIKATVGGRTYTCKVRVFNKLTQKQAEKAVRAYCLKMGYEFWYSSELVSNKCRVWVHYTSTGVRGKYVVNRDTGKVTCYEPYGLYGLAPQKTVTFSALNYL